MSKVPFFAHQSAFAATDSDIAALYWEMRCGKTRAVIAWVLNRLAANERAGSLVVAPVATLLNWRDELALFGIEAVILTGSPDQRMSQVVQADEAGVRWFLINPEGLFLRGSSPRARDVGASPVAMLPWEAVVLDEATRFKNPQARITKVALRWLVHARVKAILTGLPDPEGPSDYFCPMVFLYGSFMGHRKFWDWQQEYFYRPWKFADWMPLPGTRTLLQRNIDILANRMTRRQAGVGGAKVYKRFCVSLPGTAAAAYRILEKEWALGSTSHKHIVARDVALQRLLGGYYPECPHRAKEDALVTLLGREWKGEPVVVWFRFNTELFGVAERLQAAGRKVLTITGDDSRQLRQDKQQLMREGHSDALLVQLACGSHGLDFSWCDTFIYYSNFWSADTRQQSEDRGIHPTKKGSVLIVDLVVPDTLDEAATDALRKKKNASALMRARMLAWCKTRRSAV